MTSTIFPVSTNGRYTEHPQVTSNLSNRGWIFSPLIDLLFSCGAFLWIVMAVCALSPWKYMGVAWAAWTGDLSNFVLPISVAGSIMFNYPHIAATWVELYGDSGTRRQHPYVSYLAPAALVTAVVLSASQASILTVLVNVYTLFVVQHFTAQSFGIVMIYCKKNQCKLDSGERTQIKHLFQSIMLYGITRQFAQSGAMDSSFGFNQTVLAVFPVWVSAAMFVLVILAVLRLSVTLAKRFADGSGTLPLPAYVLLATTMAVFLLGPDFFGKLWLLVPAFFHASQYLVVTTACRMSRAERDSTSQTNEKFGGVIKGLETVEYICLCVLLGFAVFALFKFGAQLSGLTEASAITATTCAIGLHHFLADGFLWRGRNSRANVL